MNTFLIKMPELVLTFNTFSFDSEHYQQISGVVMGTKMGHNYANVFVSVVENKSLKSTPIPYLITFVHRLMTV